MHCSYQKEPEARNELSPVLDAVDDGCGAEDLVGPGRNPGQVEHEERRHDRYGNVGHPDLLGVPVGPALVQQHDPLANTDVQDYQN